jgi:uncharacterized protein
MVSLSPHARIGRVGLGDARWTGGFWGDRFEVCRTSMVPKMWETLADASLAHAYANFRIAAGLEAGEHKGPPFFDGDLYKWLEAAASVYAARKDPALDRLMDEVIGVIAAAQRADGYLHTPVLIAERNRSTTVPGAATDAAPGAVRALEDRLHFEVYNLGHLMSSACAHHAATGKRTFLEVARRAGDFLRVFFREPSAESAKNNICPAHYMGLIDLYRTTGEAAYRDLVMSLIEMRNLMGDGTDDNQDRIPFREQRKAVGHAVRANYLYAGAVDAFLETGDRTLLPALSSLWEDVTATKTYVTGATGALYDGVSPYGAEDHWSIQRIHQAYGRAYQLPQTTAYNETCATIGNVLWNHRMFAVTGDARCMDTVETALYNGVLAGVSLDGERFFYKNTLRQEKELPFPLRWPRSRQRFLSSYCCPPNVVRTVARSADFTYGATGDGVWVNLYGGGELATTLPDGSPLALRQETDYPWDGKVAVTLDTVPEREFSVSLRIPAWAEGASLSLNGKPWSGAPASGRYAEVRRAWKPGDRLDLKLPLQTRLLCAHPLVEEVRNQTAVARGPLIYCLESIDLPAGVDLAEVLIPSDIELVPQTGTGALSGITVLTGTAERIPALRGDASLYRPLPSGKPEGIRVTLIPYYAWDNRGQSAMSVWLPVRWRGKGNGR